jgi:predicted MFS family arabinose efflux permease
MVGRLLAKIGHRRTIRMAASLSICGLFLTALPSLGSVVAGLAAVSVAAFATQTTASSYIAQMSGEQRTLASGIYLSFYYLGGCVGSILPGFAWSAAGWVGCVALLVVVQSAIFRLGRRYLQVR